MLKKTTIVFCALVAVAWGYSAGAPESTCDDLTPKHPVAPQSSKFPYKVSADKSEIKAGETAVITISGGTFKGFLIQVRNGDKAVGSFEVPDTDKYTKTINCHGGNASGATHKNSVDKKEIALKWKAPSASGEFQIFSTVAEDGGTFWAAQPGQKIKVN